MLNLKKQIVWSISIFCAHNLPVYIVTQGNFNAGVTTVYAIYRSIPQIDHHVHIPHVVYCYTAQRYSTNLYCLILNI